MSRELLPQRRASETFEFTFAGQHRYVATLGYYEDGRLGEVFLSAAKRSTELDIAARDQAILLSFALQNGVTVESIRSAMTRDATGRPEGPMGTLLDLLAERDQGRAE